MNEKIAISTLSALAHPARLDLFRALVKAGPEGLSVGEISDQCEQKLSTVSAQLGKMAQTGLLKTQRDGKSVFYIADYTHFAELISFLMKDCCGGNSNIANSVLSALSSTDCSNC